jgi:hypothetical protein
MRRVTRAARLPPRSARSAVRRSAPCMPNRATFVGRAYALHASSDMSRTSIIDARHRALLPVPHGQEREQLELHVVGGGHSDIRSQAHPSGGGVLKSNAKPAERPQHGTPAALPGVSSDGPARRENLKQHPRLGWASTQIFPPCRSMIFLQIDKPIPLPGYSARPCRRRKMIKTSFHFSSGMPIPLSDTARTHSWSRRCASI